MDNAAALPTAPAFAHKLHSLPPPVFKSLKTGTAGFYRGDKYSDAGGAVEVIRAVANSHLSTTPYSYRKVGHRPTLRELIVPFGSTGYVLRFDIRTPELVLVIGARHQREEDFH